MNPAKEYLLEIQKLDEVIARKIAEKHTEVERAKAAANSITPQLTADRVQSTPNPQRMASAIDDAMDVENEYNAIIAGLRAKRQSIIQDIESLPLDEYKVLHCLYVKGMILKEAAFDCGMSYSWTKGVHGQALKDINEILTKRKSEKNLDCTFSVQC